MAFVQEFDNEEQRQAPVQGQGQVITSTGASTITGGSQSPAAAQGGAGARPTRTGWSNLQNYIIANRGNDAAMGQRVANKIGEQSQGVETAKAAITPAAQEDITRGTVTDQGVIETLRTAPTRVDKEQYKKQSRATYQGPEDISAYADFAKGQQAAKNLEERLNLIGTEAGQKTLLKDIAGPNYGQGLSNLDQFILSAGEEGKKSIAGTKEQYGATPQAWQTFVEDINARLGGAKQTTERTAEETRKAYEDVFGATKGDIAKTQATLPDVNKQRTAQVTELQGKFASKDPKVRADLAKTLGITPQVLDYLQNTLGYKPQEIVSYAGDLALGDIVDPEARARYEALLNLEDQQGEFSFAGTSRKDPTQVKKDILEAAASAMKLRDAVTSRTAAEQKKRDETFKRVQEKVAKGIWDQEVFRETGLTREDVEIAKRGSVGGGMVRDLGQFSPAVSLATALRLTPGAALNVGDIATPEERKAWDNLMKILGSRDKLSLVDVQQEGKAVRANVPEFRKDVEQARTESGKQASINTFKSKLSRPDEYEQVDNTPTGQERKRKKAALQEFLSSGASSDQKLAAIQEYEIWTMNNPTIVTVG